MFIFSFDMINTLRLKIVFLLRIEIVNFYLCNYEFRHKLHPPVNELLPYFMFVYKYHEALAKVD